MIGTAWLLHRWIIDADGNNPLEYDAGLDIYNPKNGPPFSDEFRKRYEAAQIERNDKITRWCLDALKRIEPLGNRYARYPAAAEYSSSVTCSIQVA